MFEQYKDRKIESAGIWSMKGWQIKVYTITVNQRFKSDNIKQAAHQSLSKFIDGTQATKLQNYKIAFLIIHEGREGVWILFNWWMDGEMIQTKVSFVDYESPENIIDSPHGNGLVCIWELEVFIFERSAWIQHILKRATKPHFDRYLNDHLKSS